MKKLFFTACAILFSLGITAQNMESLEPKVAAFHSYLVNNDIDKIIENSYPKLFSIMPEDFLRRTLSSAYSRPEVSISLLGITPEFSYGEIKKIGNANYCLISYIQSKKMVYANIIAREDIKGVKAALLQGNKYESAVFCEKENAMVVTEKIHMIAVADSYSDYKWSFLICGRTADEIVELILDDEIKKVLGL